MTTMADQTLLMLLNDVRSKTLSELKGLDDIHARWAPPGLQNSCLWHGGHAYFVTEFLITRAVGRTAKLPDGWLKMFSWESNPAHTLPDCWPPLDEVREALIEQHERLREVIGRLSPEQLDAPEPGNPARTVRYAILHGLHDEARHSGEISLLRKMMQNTFVVRSPSLP
jgi:DinB superfamily